MDLLLLADSKSLLKCSACHEAVYCDASCQKNDWKVHKPVCIIYRNFRKITKLFENEYIEVTKRYIREAKTICKGERFTIMFDFENLKRLEDIMDISQVLSGSPVVVNIKYVPLSKSKKSIHETMERSINKPWYDMLDMAEVYNEKNETLIVLTVPNGSGSYLIKPYLLQVSD